MIPRKVDVAVDARVRIRRQWWTVKSWTAHQDCRAVRVSGSDRVHGATDRTFLLPFDRIESAPAISGVRAVGRRGWWHEVAHAYLRTCPFGGLRSAARAAIHLLPFQLEPALAVVRHARLRVLIADEVGLGKTVQAGILLAELSSRDDGFRGLVLCPAGLREQWRCELASKLSLDTTLADASWLASTARDLPADISPWSLPGVYVASLDLVKRPEVLRALEDTTWDLLVIDEVHTLGIATARLAAARAIAARSRHVVLMTATPPDGDASHFSAIVEIGRAPDEAPITEFRRTRADVGLHASRRSVLLGVRPSSDESRMHRLLERYTSLVWHEAVARGDRTAQLAVMVLRKRALSSAGALALSVQRRLALLGNPLPERHLQLPLPLGDEDPLDDRLSDELMSANGLADVWFERRCLTEIASAAGEAAAAESKLRVLVRLLSRIREPAIVFTEYRDTLLRIAAALPHALAPHLLHGAMPPRERTEVLHSFSRSGRLLLATDAASEGLNLHERCRLVIHFELPWMPARLEQRSGRVDRLGQTQRVHELLLVARDTAERLVLAPLVRRMRTAAAQGHRSITALDESSVARLIIAGSSVEDSAPLKTSTSSLDLRIEAEIECRRLITHRRIRTRTSEFRSADDLAVSTLSPRRPGFTWIIVELGLKDPSGRVVHGELVPLVLRIQSTLRSGNRAEARCWGTSLADCLRTRVAALASRERSTFLDEARERIGIAADVLKRRERWIADATPATAQALVQAGLFDRRAIRAAAARSVVSRQLEVEAAHRLRILEEEQAVHLDARVVALGGRM